MLLEILPIKLFDSPNIRTLFRNDKAAIFHKTLHNDLIDKEMYLSSVAMLYVIKGHQVINHYDGNKVLVERGQLLYLSKDMYLVSDFVADKAEFEAMIFFFDDKFIQRESKNTLRPVDSNNKIQVLQKSAQISQFVQSILDVYTHETENHFLLELKLLELIELIKLHSGGKEFLSLFNSFANAFSSSHLNNDADSSSKRDIRRFMEDNVLKNLSVDDYATLTGRSRSTFIRDFKKLYQTTPNQWLIEQRLNKAKDLLIQTDLNVTQTAFEVGYENVSHFIKAYINTFDITPKQEKSRVMTRIAY
jgi:AraC-like DNA-binding protein